VSLWLIERRLLKRAATVHFTSLLELQEAERLGLMFHGAVIPLGVDYRGAGHVEIVSRGRIAVAERNVLFLSRIDPIKKLEVLLHAFQIMTRDGFDGMLSIAGDGPPDYVSTLKALAAALSIEDRVRWLGRVDGAEKGKAFSSAHVFVLPSLSENFGIAIVEAMLAGLPCVVTPGVGIAEDIERAGAGVLALPEAAAIAAATAAAVWAARRNGSPSKSTQLVSCRSA
jgi:glycosyltransferase involved in cell wall biosynthesis